MKKYKIIALLGKAGSGKDSVLHKILSRCPLVNRIVCLTTRPKREKEIDGIDYHFIDGDTFGEKMLDFQIIEASIFNDWFYGTSVEDLKTDTINIGIYSPSAIRNLLENPEVDITIFYLIASDKARLLRQLNREDCPDVNEIVRRFHTDIEDFSDMEFGGAKLIALPNETAENLNSAVEIIASYIEDLGKTL